MRVLFFAAALGTLTMGMAAQGNPVDVRTDAAIMTQAKALVAQAKAAPDGVASVTLESYPGHHTMLAVRVKSGLVEVHAHDNDLFFVEEGEATVVTGGTVVDPKEIAPGETHGTKIEGGTPHVLHKGDVMHIQPNVPHQVMVTSGKPFIYYTVKVTKPQ